LHDLLHTDILRHYDKSLTRLAKISLYDVAPNILGMFDQNLRKYTEKTFSREGISLLTSHNVDKVEAGKLFVKEQGEGQLNPRCYRSPHNIDDDLPVPFGMLVWSTGLAPNPLVQSLQGVKKDPKTSRFVLSTHLDFRDCPHQRCFSIITDDHLNMIMEDGQANEDVWVIGDASKIEDAPLPATAQVASQKAKYLVKKLNRIVNDVEHKKPFEFHNQGSLAYIGNW
jgi:NADH dehydrogenase FAD-containing subunit